MPYFPFIPVSDDSKKDPSYHPAKLGGKYSILGAHSYRREDGMLVVPRMLFACQYFPYHPGEHVVFGGPSKRGKTRLAFDLLMAVVSSECPAYVAVSKPTDKETEQRGKEMQFRFVEDWPPQRRIGDFFNGGPCGYVVWPRFGNISEDFTNAARVTATLLGDRYTASTKSKTNTSPGILVMDDTMVKAKIMNLDNQMVTILAMAGAMEIGMWTFIQKPTDSGRVTLWAYENADHLFFTKGGDARMLRRYQEIAGEHSDLVRQVIPTLEQYQFLYLHENTACIVDAG